MKNSTPIPSEQTQQEALRIAKATQRPAQTKEQTKLIAQGIEKGIALYKKQQKEKHRQADKLRKKALKAKLSSTTEICVEEDYTSEFIDAPQANQTKIAWGLLVISWVGFIAYWLWQNQL
ncbi:hypothetical protein VOA_002496 [Vibrio sp. RC586]|uniref:DUF2956 domain-containing protein n=1 Tax=Vibrio sp. RC586 TaxID=675815 RepID=UPI0001BB8219|nr:DUF2956 domain-containing protein [Vibrio sp. RC586]EEY98672.1 hypothetical protein VOA_002496 [Vibrio sp. RC586]